MQMTISFAVFDNEPSGAEAEGPNVPEIERTAQFTPRTQSTSNSPLHLTTYKCIDFEGKLAMHKKTR
ncbi:hypothetical protein QYM36_006712, partial [Artemia franciscana]